MRHVLKVGLTVIDPFLRKFDRGFLRFLRVDESLIHSKGLKHTFTVFTLYETKMSGLQPLGSSRA
jgi:hypothetical protein